MYILWCKLKILQHPMRASNRETTEGMMALYNNIIQLEKAQQKLAEDSFDQDYIQEVKHWNDDVIKENEIKEKILIQKSKIDWLKLGDGNNAYFYAHLKAINKQTNMHKLEDQHGNLLTEMRDVKQ